MGYNHPAVLAASDELDEEGRAVRSGAEVAGELPMRWPSVLLCGLHVLIARCLCTAWAIGPQDLATPSNFLHTMFQFVAELIANRACSCCRYSSTYPGIALPNARDHPLFKHARLVPGFQ